jgi:dolichol-phosphate mannosyltransferase
MSGHAKDDLKLSIIIPARNEAKNLKATIPNIAKTLDAEKVPFEIIVVDDHSRDDTSRLVAALHEEDGRISRVANDYPPGYGFAVRKGLDVYNGDAAAIVMADGSDEPADIVKYCRVLEKGYDCAFGTRFSRHSKVTGYPRHKFIFNRLGNWFIQLLFWLPYNDVTNAFKCYRRTAIDGIKPLVSCHFNLTVEMPLKAIVRGYTWGVVSTNWYGREKGVSKWRIKEFGSRYMFIILYVWLEKMLTKGDYQKGKYWLKGR